MAGSVRSRAAAWARTGPALALLVALVAGCSVTTDVDVRVRPSGAGTVSVTVALDAAANAEIGGLRQMFDSAGLAAEGWTVTWPGPGAPAGGSTVSAVHPFSGLGDLPGLLAEVGTSGGRPLFAITVRRTATSVTNDTVLAGRVDLRCGVDCFGDAGLRRSFGSSVGVAAGVLERADHETAAEALHFAVTVELPGRVTTTNGTRLGPGAVRWVPRLGGMSVLSASIVTRDRPHTTGLLAVAVIGAGGLLLLLVVVAGVVRRRRRPAAGGTVAARR